MQVKRKALRIIGVDEAGRGSWAGPVFAAAFAVLDSKVLSATWWSRLADSKTLSGMARDTLFAKLHEAKTKGYVEFEIASSSSVEIDEFGIKEANRMAMSRALQALDRRWCTGGKIISIDGNDGYVFPELGPDRNVEFIIRGDSKVKSISAASILAKVARDNYMVGLSETNSKYGFEFHKWYGTKKHAEMLSVFWPSSDHRASYAPIKNLLSTPKDLYFSS